MATTLAETYYLKALESYPFELGEVMENLTYALGYNEEHPAANCLMGKLQMQQLKNYRAAEEYFQSAITSDPEYACAYENLVVLYIHMGNYVQAQQVLNYARHLPTISRSFVLWAMALILERRGQMKLSKYNMKASLAEALSSGEREFLELELQRIKAKAKARKKLCK